jgi:ABC-2 type transport system ATP-binding protein
MSYIPSSDSGLSAPIASPAEWGSQPQPLLHVEALYKYYREFLAVNGVSLSLWPGEVVGLVGPNGAGKTTILRCITGILRPTQGTVICGGYRVDNQPAQAKPLMSLVPETPNLYELLTVEEHLRFIHMAYGEQDQFDERAEVLLRSLSLEDKRHSLVATLSKGMKQKVAVACAFIHSARVFLFDEPFMGIDPAGQRSVRNLIHGATAQGCAVLISSHILETVEALCSRVLVLNHGSLIAEGDIDQLRERARMGSADKLEDVFLTLTREGGTE